MWRGLVLLSILVVAACTNGAREVSRSGEPNESDTPPPAASIDLETVDLVELITWDQLDFLRYGASENRADRANTGGYCGLGR